MEDFMYRTSLSLFLALVLSLVAGCGGHAGTRTKTPTIAAHAGVFLSTENGWGNLPTVIQIEDQGGIVGNIYGSVDDAQQAIAENYQFGLGAAISPVYGSIAFATPATPDDAALTMTLQIHLPDGTVQNVQSSASFTEAGILEVNPTAIWTEVAK
jgi:hypothetical protein